MLALVLVVGHFILSRLGIAYKAVTAFYSSGGPKSICNGEEFAEGAADIAESFHRSRYKSTPGAATTVGYSNQATTVGYSNQATTIGYANQTAATMARSGLSVGSGGQQQQLMGSSGGPLTEPGGGALSDAQTALPTSASATGRSKGVLSPQDDTCGPEVSPSRIVTGPAPQCVETAAWRTNRHRSAFGGGTSMTMQPTQQQLSQRYDQRTMNTGYPSMTSGYYTGQSRQTAMIVDGYDTEGRALSSMGRSMKQSGYQPTVFQSGYPPSTGYPPPSMGQSSVQQQPPPSSMGRGTNGDLTKLRVQFRPSKIPSAYRFPRPDDIPCSNEDYPPEQQQQQHHMGSGSHLTSYTTTTTPRASPPRSVSSPRTQQGYGRGSAMTNPPHSELTYEAYLDEDVNEVVSMSSNYQAQLGGVSSHGGYGGSSERGVGAVPQAPTTIGYSHPSIGQPQTGGPRPSGTMYGTPSAAYLQTQQGLQPPLPPQQQSQQISQQQQQQSLYQPPLAYTSHTTRTGYPSQMDPSGGMSSASRVMTTKSAVNKTCKPIPAWDCGKTTGFDDGPLPRPPKRKTMSAAEDYFSSTQSRASTKRSQVLGIGGGSLTPSSTASPDSDFMTTSISQMPHSQRSMAPTNMTRNSNPGSVMSTNTRQSMGGGTQQPPPPPTLPPSSHQMSRNDSPPQKTKSRHSSGLYSVHASGIRSVSEQDVQQVQSLAPPHYVSTSLSRAGTATSSQGQPSRKSQAKSAVLEMDCTNIDQYNDY